jgi:exodeoxyribonuclease-5
MEGQLKELMDAPEPDDPNESEMLAEMVLELQFKIREERNRIKGPLFRLNPDSIVTQASLIVLDECSMVNEDLAADLLSFGRKVLVLGDPAQLPPVKGAGYFTNRQPDLLLTEIHRQARDNPIIRWSMLAREGKPIPFADEGRARKVHKDDIDATWLVNEGGQLLVGKNETRRKLNQRIRRTMGHTSVYPEKGERLVVLRNDRQLNVLNGVVCQAADHAAIDEDGDVYVDLEYEGRPVPLVWVDTREFRAYADPKASEEYDPGYRDKLQLDYGYALTVHKSQGSQWDVVTLCDDGFGKGYGGPDLRKQWLYTGITRAAEHLNIVS